MTLNGVGSTNGIDSGVDSEISPSSPDSCSNVPSSHSSTPIQQLAEDHNSIMETAETLLALSGKKRQLPSTADESADGKKRQLIVSPTGSTAEDARIREYMSREDTAVVFPQHPDLSAVMAGTGGDILKAKTIKDKGKTSLLML